MSGRVPIVLCCAEEAEPTLIGAVDALHQEGYLTEVVVGVETDATLLTATVDRMRGAALFVLCQSEDLDRFQVRRLEGLFSARRGPEHQMITVDVVAEGPMAVVNEVRIAARSGGGDDGPLDEDDGRHMRDVVVSSTVAAPGATIPSTRRDPIAQEPLGISEEALGMEPEAPPVSAPRKLFPEPDVLIATDPTGETVSPFDNKRFDPSMFGDGVPNEVEQDFPVVGESSADVEVAGAPSRVNYDPSGSVGIEKVSRRVAEADDRREATIAPFIERSGPSLRYAEPEPEEEEPEEVPERRRGRLGLLLIAGAGMAGVIAMAVMHGSAPTVAGPAGGTAERGVPTSRGVSTQTADSGAAAGGSVGAGAIAAESDGGVGGGSSGGADDATPSTGLQGGVATAADASGESGSDGAETATDSGTTGADPSADASTTADEANESTSGEGDSAGEDGSDGAGAASPTPKSVPPPPTADPTKAQLDAAIDAALADGRLEAMGELLVVRSGSNTMTWDEAAAKCRRRKVEGLRNWRLPSKGQLFKLRKAKMLSGGSYWSRSVVGGDEVYALDAGSGRMNVWLKMEPNARALCVRKRPSGS